MSIPFTQYMLPNGRQRKIELESDEETEEKARKLLEAGYCFDVEILSTGVVSLTCENYETEETAGIVLSHNDERIQLAVKELVNNSHKMIFKNGKNRKENNNEQET